MEFDDLVGLRVINKHFAMLVKAWAHFKILPPDERRYESLKLQNNKLSSSTTMKGKLYLVREAYDRLTAMGQALHDRVESCEHYSLSARTIYTTVFILAGYWETSEMPEGARFQHYVRCMFSSNLVKRMKNFHEHASEQRVRLAEQIYATKTAEVSFLEDGELTVYLNVWANHAIQLAKPLVALKKQERIEKQLRRRIEMIKKFS